VSRANVVVISGPTKTPSQTSLHSRGRPQFREVGAVSNEDKGADDDKNLRTINFRIGDYMDVAIYTRRRETGGAAGGGPGGGVGARGAEAASATNNGVRRAGYERPVADRVGDRLGGRAPDRERERERERGGGERERERERDGPRRDAREPRDARDRDRRDQDERARLDAELDRRERERAR
jgi:hypothetical protein